MAYTEEDVEREFYQYELIRKYGISQCTRCAICNYDNCPMENSE